MPPAVTNVRAASLNASQNDLRLQSYDEADNSGRNFISGQVPTADRTTADSATNFLLSIAPLDFAVLQADLFTQDRAR